MINKFTCYFHNFFSFSKFGDSHSKELGIPCWPPPKIVTISKNKKVIGISFSIQNFCFLVPNYESACWVRPLTPKNIQDFDYLDPKIEGQKCQKSTKKWYLFLFDGLYLKSLSMNLIFLCAKKISCARSFFGLYIVFQ